MLVFANGDKHCVTTIYCSGCNLRKWRGGNSSCVHNSRQWRTMSVFKMLSRAAFIIVVPYHVVQCRKQSNSAAVSHGDSHDIETGMFMVLVVELQPILSAAHKRYRVLTFVTTWRYHNARCSCSFTRSMTSRCSTMKLLSDT